jgi:hypothetical protein
MPQNTYIHINNSSWTAEACSLSLAVGGLFRVSVSVTFYEDDFLGLLSKIPCKNFICEGYRGTDEQFTKQQQTTKFKAMGVFKHGWYMPWEVNSPYKSFLVW